MFFKNGRQFNSGTTSTAVKDFSLLVIVNENRARFICHQEVSRYIALSEHALCIRAGHHLHRQQRGRGGGDSASIAPSPSPPPLPPRAVQVADIPGAILEKVQPIEWVDLRDMIQKPVYLGLQDAVIKTQPIRPPKLTTIEVDQPLSTDPISREQAKEDKSVPEEKPQTRIPVSRFKPAVERVQRERRESEKAKKAPEKPRRSSIPKLRVPITRKNPTGDDPDHSTEKEPANKPCDGTPARTITRKPIRSDRIPVMKKDHYKIVKREGNAKTREETPNIAKQEEPFKMDSNVKLDDEFDKLYDEIVDTDVVSLPDGILETKFKDPEKIESKFEEIVHQYDDETIEQVKIEPVDKARYSKIPLLRRRSSQDINIHKQSERKLSLKIGDKTLKRDDEKLNNTKPTSNDDVIKPDGVREGDKVEPTDGTEDEEVQDNSIEINNNDENFIIIQSPNPIPDLNTIPTPEAERVKVGIFGMATRDIPIEDNTNQNIEVTTPVLETVKLAVIDIPAEESLQSINCYIETEASPSDNQTTEEPTNKEHNDSFVSLVEPELVKDVDDEIYDTQNQTDIEAKTGIEDAKGIIRPVTPIINDDTTSTVQSLENHVNQHNNDVLLSKPDDELKSFSLLQKVNSVEERTKSRYINKPINKENDSTNTKTLEEEIPVKGKVSSILKRLTSQDPSNNDFNKRNAADLKKEELHALKPAEDISRNNSVLTKIAMFERVEPPSLVKKPVHRYSKPKRTISEEMRHSPKIVQEVLKPKDIEKTDKHAIVTIDISKPVEVITNNEEQVMVVEELKEKTIEFENLDDNKLNRTETIQTRLKELNDTHESISREDNKLYAAEPKESKEYRKMSVTRDKVLDDVDAPVPQDASSDIKQKELLITHQTILRNDDDNKLIAPKDTRKISVTRNQILDDIDAIDPIYSDINPTQSDTHHAISRNISVTRDKILEDNVDILNERPELNNDVNDQNGAIHPLREDNVERTPRYVKSNDKKLYNKLYSKLDDIYNKQSKIKDNYEPNHIARQEHKPKDVKDDHYYEKNNIESIKNDIYNKEDKKEKWKITDALADFVPVKEKINRLTSYDESNMKKAKSTAELDLGDAVKGKVKNMIVRMNSSDLLDDVKAKDTLEVINAKERPRKRSVSEKIALFERKLVPVAMEDAPDIGRSLNPDTKPLNIDGNAVSDGSVKPNILANVTDKDVKSNLEVSNVEDIAAKIKELQEAKKKYGTVDVGSMVLRDGRKMPVMALGTALLDPRLAKHIVAAAIDLGFRAIDTAFIYGTEREVGEGIKMKIQDGTVKREDLFIMSKLWSTFHKPELVEGACRASLDALGLEYFDLFMIHNPMSFKEGGDPIPKIANVIQFSSYDYMDAWYAMENLVSKGLVRSIGVSNFNSVQLARVLEKGRIKPVVNQVECHPYLNQALLSDFCEVRDVRLSCFGVLGSKGTPPELKNNTGPVIEDAMVRIMAAGLNMSTAQMLIRYQIDRGHSVVVKASSGSHLWDNLQALGVYLKPSEIQTLNALNRNRRTFTFKGMGDTHRNYPFAIAY